MKDHHFKILGSVPAIILTLASIAPAQDMAQLREAADKGNVNAMYALAKRLDEKGEYREALLYLNKAGSKGHGSATAMLAHYIEFRRHYFKAEDHDEMTKAFEEINLRRYIEFSSRFLNEKNLDETSIRLDTRWIAFKLYQSAAKRGSAHAMFRIGVYYLKGAKITLPGWVAEGYGNIMGARKATKVKGEIGYYSAPEWYIDKDEKKALSWFMRGVKKGDPECIYQVAEMYKKGIGVKANTKKYIEYLSEAAKRGYIPAMLTLSGIYRTGAPIKQDTAKADQLLIDALKKSPTALDIDTIMNSPLAIEALVSAYKGVVAGIAADETKARYWEGELRNMKLRNSPERSYGRYLGDKKSIGLY